MPTITEIKGAYYIDLSLSWSDLMTIKIALEKAGVAKTDDVMKTIKSKFRELDSYIIKTEHEVQNARIN